MRINIRMSFDWLHFDYFFFCVCMEKDIRRIWTNPLYVDLHLDQPSSEPVYLKNEEIKIILLKKLLLITKSETTMSA